MKLHLRVHISVKTDLSTLWQNICQYNGASLGGSMNDWTVFFDGDVQSGLEVLTQCLAYSDVGKFYADYGE